jgi:hypothetical protein
MNDRDQEHGRRLPPLPGPGSLPWWWQKAREAEGLGRWIGLAALALVLAGNALAHRGALPRVAAALMEAGGGTMPFLIGGFWCVCNLIWASGTENERLKRGGRFGLVCLLLALLVRCASGDVGPVCRRDSADTARSGALGRSSARAGAGVRPSEG